MGVSVQGPAVESSQGWELTESRDFREKEELPWYGRWGEMR